MKKQKYRKINRAVVELSINEYYAVKKKDENYQILKSIVERKLKIDKNRIKNIVWFNKPKVYVYYYAFSFNPKRNMKNLDKALSITIDAILKV